jgi:hypothetical protein
VPNEGADDDIEFGSYATVDADDTSRESYVTVDADDISWGS